MMMPQGESEWRITLLQVHCTLAELFFFVDVLISHLYSHRLIDALPTFCQTKEESHQLCGYQWEMSERFNRQQILPAQSSHFIHVRREIVSWIIDFFVRLNRQIMWCLFTLFFLGFLCEHSLSKGEWSVGYPLLLMISLFRDSRSRIYYLFQTAHVSGALSIRAAYQYDCWSPWRKTCEPLTIYSILSNTDRQVKDIIDPIRISDRCRYLRIQ